MTTKRLNSDWDASWFICSFLHDCLWAKQASFYYISVMCSQACTVPFFPGKWMKITVRLSSSRGKFPTFLCGASSHAEQHLHSAHGLYCPLRWLALATGAHQAGSEGCCLWAQNLPFCLPLDGSWQIFWHLIKNPNSYLCIHLLRSHSRFTQWVSDTGPYSGIKEV